MDLMERVNWTEPARQQQLRRGHLVYLLKHSKFTLATLLALSVFGLVSVIRGGDWWLLAGGAIIGGLLALRFSRYLASVVQAAQAAGPSIYRLLESGLDVQNALGAWTVGWAHIERVEVAGDLLLVTYAGRALLSLPAGPLARALRARWHSFKVGS